MKQLATATVRLYPKTRKTLKILAAKRNTSIAQTVEELLSIE